MKLSTKTNCSPLVSLTPLIDVVFILLIFFMLVSQFTQLQKQSIPLKTVGEATTKPHNTISIEITKNEHSNAIHYRINNIAMNYLQIEIFIQENTVDAVLLMPAENISLQTFIDVKENLSNLGIKNISSDFNRYEIN